MGKLPLEQTVDGVIAREPREVLRREWRSLAEVILPVELGNDDRLSAQEAACSRD